MGRLPIGPGSETVPSLRIAQDPAADELLGRVPLALPLGVLLVQQMRRRSSVERRVILA